jgi:hypothetical protein
VLHGLHLGVDYLVLQNEGFNQQHCAAALAQYAPPQPPTPPPSPPARALPLEGVCVWRSLTLLAWLGGRWEALERANGQNANRPGRVWIMPDPAHCKVRTNGVACVLHRARAGRRRGDAR